MWLFFFSFFSVCFVFYLRRLMLRFIMCVFFFCSFIRTLCNQFFFCFLIYFGTHKLNGMVFFPFLLIQHGYCVHAYVDVVVSYAWENALRILLFWFNFVFCSVSFFLTLLIPAIFLSFFFFLCSSRRAEHNSSSEWNEFEERWNEQNTKMLFNVGGCVVAVILCLNEITLDVDGFWLSLCSSSLSITWRKTWLFIYGHFKCRIFSMCSSNCHRIRMQIHSTIDRQHFIRKTRSDFQMTCCFVFSLCKAMRWRYFTSIADA